MPLKLEPGQTFDVWLEVDADKPAADRPTFEVSVLSVRQQRRLSNAIDRLMDVTNLESTDEFYDGFIDLVMEHVSGWRNMGMELTRDNVEDLLTYRELQDLLNRIQIGQDMSDEEKKRSESQQ